MNNQAVTIAKQGVRKGEESEVDFLSTEAAVVLLMFNILVGIVAIYVHLLVLKMLKREEFSFGSELRVFIYVNMLCMPLLLLFNSGMVNLMYPAADVIGLAFCDITMTFLVFNVQRLFVHSLVIILFKYVYTVHHETVLRYGQGNMNLLISSLSWAFPIIITASTMIVKKEVDPVFWVNACYGYDDAGGGNGTDGTVDSLHNACIMVTWAGMGVKAAAAGFPHPCVR